MKKYALQHFTCKTLEAHLLSIVMVLVVIYHDHLYVHYVNIIIYIYIYKRQCLRIALYHIVLATYEHQQYHPKPTNSHPHSPISNAWVPPLRPRSKISAKLSNSCKLHRAPILQRTAKKTNGARGRNLGGMCLPGRRACGSEFYVWGSFISFVVLDLFLVDGSDFGCLTYRNSLEVFILELLEHVLFGVEKEMLIC